jgi:hypothetical protein
LSACPAPPFLFCLPCSACPILDLPLACSVLLILFGPDGLICGSIRLYY